MAGRTEGQVQEAVAKRLEDLFREAHEWAQNHDYSAACFKASEAIQEYEEATK